MTTRRSLALHRSFLLFSVTWAALTASCASDPKAAPPGGGSTGAGGATGGAAGNGSGTATGGGTGAGTGGNGGTGSTGTGTGTGTGGNTGTGSGGATGTGTGGSAGAGTGTGGSAGTGTGAGGNSGGATAEAGAPAPVVNQGCLLVPSPTGWIDGKSNNANIQGAVYTYRDTGGSTITPLTGPTQGFTNAGDGKLCVKGTAAQAVGGDYAKYFGVAMGIDLCHGPINTTTKYTLGTCPGGSKLVGLRFKVTGAAIPPSLRATLNEPELAKRKSYVIIASGTNTVTFAGATVLDTPTAPPVTVPNIDGVHFTIATNAMAPVPFDFCIEQIEPLTSGGTCDMGFAGKPDGGSPVVNMGPGVLPTNVTAAEAKTAYEAWKTTYVTSCGAGGKSYVKALADGTTYSEAIGYGMLLAVAHGDKATFDALYPSYTAAMTNGLMDWRVAGCGGPNGSGSASDGDLDVAMALVQATCKFGAAYDTPARSLIGTIKARSIAATGGLQVLKPGASFQDATCVNVSYFSPGYYRAFSKFTNDAMWDTLATDSYTIINRVANATTGLVPNWGHTDGTAAHGECAGYADATLYTYDAARTPWRVATDFRWWSAPAAKTYLTKVLAWANSVGIDTMGDKYQTNGTMVNAFPTPVTRGPLANATIISDQATADRFYQSFKGVTVNEYYPVTLKALSMAFGAGLFESCIK